MNKPESRELKTKTGSIYKLFSDGRLTKNGHDLGQGYYLGTDFLLDWVEGGISKVFSNEKEKLSFQKSAAQNPYTQLKGRIVFFNKHTPLKMEYSEKVIEANPSFENNRKGDLEDLSEGTKDEFVISDSDINS